MNAINERRRFRLLDAMLLTAAIAIGLAFNGMLESVSPFTEPLRDARVLQAVGLSEV
ncbi:MAG: hypothetical protein AAF802_19945 [Planctomycetota bacterium]